MAMTDASIHGLLVGRDGQVGVDAKRVLRRRQISGGD